MELFSIAAMVRRISRPESKNSRTRISGCVCSNSRPNASTGIRILGEVAMTNCSVATAGEISSPRHITLIPTSQLHFIAFSLSQGMQLSCLPGVVAAQRLDLVSKRPARERVEQMCERWMRLEVGGRHDEIVPGGLDWDEIQSEQLRGRSNADADIRVMACNGTSHVNMRPQNCVVALYPGRV